MRNLETEPLGTDAHGQAVYLREVWPDPDEVRETLARVLDADMFRKRYAAIGQGDAAWEALAGPEGDMWRWDEASTFLKRAPFFEDMPREA